MRHAPTPALVVIWFAALLVACDGNTPPAPVAVDVTFLDAKPAPPTSGFATLSKLAPIKGGQHGEAYAANRAGTVIVGYSWDQAGLMHPVTWTLQAGVWTITKLPYSPTASSAKAVAINDQGDVAGNDFPGNTPHAVLWPASGGFVVLGCGDLGEGLAITAGGRTVVGVGRGNPVWTAALWQPGACRVDLPPLVAGGTAAARAVNGDGSIVGGTAATGAGFNAPVRWRRIGDAWQIEQLAADTGSVQGANAAGDLVGYRQYDCGPDKQCFRGTIWYADGTTRTLGTLGGLTTSPRAINSAGEVVGLSSLSNGTNTAFIWFPTWGMRQLPVTDGAWAFGLSDVRADGTRLAVGAGGKPFSALVWVVRNP
jgi:probable HAF family extracellular repeat protein